MLLSLSLLVVRRFKKLKSIRKTQAPETHEQRMEQLSHRQHMEEVKAKYRMNWN
jgi:hypothetical protein